MGKPLVMGRKTFESIGRVLDGRDSIVVSRQADLALEGAIIAPNIAAALAIAEERAHSRRAGEICVIGGGEVFAATLPLATRLYVTHIAGTPDGDAFFPPIVAEDWVEQAREMLPRSEGDSAEAVHAVYVRCAPDQGRSAGFRGIARVCGGPYNRRDGSAGALEE
jgi:dihydrofolate reductase